MINSNIHKLKVFYKLNGIDKSNDDTDSPNLDKSVSDIKSLQLIINDFFKLHPHFQYDIFLGDAALDSVSTYDFLLKENDQRKNSF